MKKILILVATTLLLQGVIFAQNGKAVAEKRR